MRLCFPLRVPFAAVSMADDRVSNEFGIPDVPNEPCLLLCPHITLLALIFADHAFAASELTSPEHLFRLRIPAGQKQLPLPLKEEMKAVPLFRRCKSTVHGVQISDEEALADSTLRPQMITLGSITGMELPTGPYTFRRGNGEALDNSSEWHMDCFSFELINIQASSPSHNGTWSCSITTPASSRRITPQGICLILRLPTAAWNLKPH